MSTISITKLYDLLTGKIGKEAAESLTLYIDDTIKNEFENRSAMLATKEDVLAAKEDMRKEISRLDIKIGETKSDVIKWMFIFWIAQVGTTFGFILLFLKK